MRPSVAEAAGPARPPQVLARQLARAMLRDAAARAADRAAALSDAQARGLEDALVQALQALLEGRLRAPLDGPWAQLLARLGLVAGPGPAALGVTRPSRLSGPQASPPLVLDGHGQLWLASQAGRGLALLQAIAARRSLAESGHWEAPLRRLSAQHQAQLEEGLAPEQVQALRGALDSPFHLIHGGPGTGKTTVVARIAAAFALCLPGPARILLASPTGRATRRLAEALERDPVLRTLPAQLRGSIHCQTLHRLLGARRGGGFHRGPRSRLMLDALLVDEGSMVSLDLAWALLSALPGRTPLAMVGDECQLPPVDFGQPFADLAADGELRGQRTSLQRAHRFAEDSGLRELVQTLRRDPPQALDMLARGGDGWRWIQTPEGEQAPSEQLLELLADEWAQRPPPARPSREWLGSYRLLCARRTGPWGEEAVNPRLQQLLRGRGLLRGGAGGRGRPPPGTPLLVRVNSPGAGLYNGDVGVVVAADDSAEPLVAFPAPSAEDGGGAGGLGGADDTDPDIGLAAADAPDGWRLLPLDMMPPHQIAWAITVHRAQGSEFDEVAVLLDPEGDEAEGGGFGGWEILYTALTRARRRVLLIGPRSRLQALLQRSARGEPVLPALRGDSDQTF